MITLTADIHNRIPNARVQTLAGQHEIMLGRKFADVALNKGIKVTFFIAGKAFDEMRNHCSYLSEEGIEVGGHTWSSFYPSWPHRISKILCGCYSGLPALQERHISMVRQRIRDYTGKEMLSWRGHGYLGDEITHKKLIRYGVKVISDDVGPGKGIQQLGPLVSLPINSIPDHEYLEFTSKDRFNPCAIPPATKGLKQFVKRLLPKDRSRFFSLSPFSSSSLKAGEWFSRLRQNIEDNIANSIPSILLIHPVTMQALDGMELYKDVIDYLASLRLPSYTVSEAARKFIAANQNTKFDSK